MDKQNATLLLEAYPHLNKSDLDALDVDEKAKLLEPIESADQTPPPPVKTSTTAPTVNSLLLAHRVGAGGSIISKSGRGVLLPGEPIGLDDLGPGGRDAWRSLVLRGKIVLHSELENPGDE